MVVHRITLNRKEDSPIMRGVLFLLDGNKRRLLFHGNPELIHSAPRFQAVPPEHPHIVVVSIPVVNNKCSIFSFTGLLEDYSKFCCFYNKNMAGHFRGSLNSWTSNR
jgi:hypothetical protein